MYNFNKGRKYILHFRMHSIAPPISFCTHSFAVVGVRADGIEAGQSPTTLLTGLSISF